MNPGMVFAEMVQGFHDIETRNRTNISTTTIRRFMTPPLDTDSMLAPSPDDALDAPDKHDKTKETEEYEAPAPPDILLDESSNLLERIPPLAGIWGLDILHHVSRENRSGSSQVS
jgi:hypothetical protein